MVGHAIANCSVPVAKPAASSALDQRLTSKPMVPDLHKAPSSLPSEVEFEAGVAGRAAMLVEPSQSPDPSPLPSLSSSSLAVSPSVGNGIIPPLPLRTLLLRLMTPRPLSPARLFALALSRPKGGSRVVVPGLPPRLLIPKASLDHCLISCGPGSHPTLLHPLLNLSSPTSLVPPSLLFLLFSINFSCWVSPLLRNPIPCAAGTLPLQSYMHDILFWNCHGARKASVGHYLHLLIATHSPSFICLLETQLESLDRELVNQLVGHAWDFFHHPSQGWSGGILVL